MGRLYDRIDADYLVSLDVPPSAANSKADRLRKYNETLGILEKLFGQFGQRVVPAVHGVSVSEVESNCRQIKRLYPSPSIIGIGGLVPTLQKCGSIRKSGPHTPQKRIANSVRCVQAHFPRSRIHLFGVGSLHTVLGVIALGARSVNSIGWRQAAGFGSVYIPGRHRRLLTLRERERPCRPFASDDDLELLTQCRCPACRGVKKSTTRIARLAHHYKPRAVRKHLGSLFGDCRLSQRAPIRKRRRLSFVAAVGGLDRSNETVTRHLRCLRQSALSRLADMPAKTAFGPSRPISHWDLTSAFGAKRKWAGGRVRCLGR